MKIGGFMKQSFVDFPATIAAVIFTSGCNLNCWYCHNRQLIDGTQEDYTLEEILEFLESRKGFIDGVVISGGEPTLQPDLLDVILNLKARGFKVKLDTNGTNPQVLRQVLPHLDYVAMDVKNSLKNYHKTVGCVDANAIKERFEKNEENYIDNAFALYGSFTVLFLRRGASVQRGKNCRNKQKRRACAHIYRRNRKYSRQSRRQRLLYYERASQGRGREKGAGGESLGRGRQREHRG